MLSTKFLLHAALFVVAAICLQMLRRIAGGREIVRVSRRSTLDADTAWANLDRAWRMTGLTFQPSEITDTEDGSRVVRTKPGSEFVLLPLEAPTGRSIIFRVLAIDGQDYLPGFPHFEHWRVEPEGSGSRVIVETRFRTTVAGSIRTLWGLWKQAGIVASPRMDAATESPATNVTPRQPAGGSARNHATPRRLRPTPAPAGYGREAIMSLLAFAYLLTQFTWQHAVVLAGVILWHEYGHLLAYQLTGRTGNRMMLVPFFGGIAVAGAPHRDEFERAFCALMGPAICAPLSLGAFALWYYDLAPEYDFWLWSIFYFSSILNLLNLLPIYPLDGGQAAESFLRSFLPGAVGLHLAGLAVVGIVVLIGFRFHEMALFVGLFSFLGLRNLPVHSALPAMSAGRAFAMAIFYAVIAAVHGGVFYFIS